MCDRLQGFIQRLETGDVAPDQLAIRNRVSKPIEEYTQSTRNVAAMERAAASGLDVYPGQDVEYIVVDDSKHGRDRVVLRHETPESYDAEFYSDMLVRAAESVLSPIDFREAQIRRYLAERVDASIRSY